jgi:hypothetical protein
MPRNGDGSSDNGPFEAADHNIAHGVGKPDVSLFLQIITSLILFS